MNINLQLSSNCAVQPTPPLRGGSLASLGAADRGRYASESMWPVTRKDRSK